MIYFIISVNSNIRIPMKKLKHFHDGNEDFSQTKISKRLGQFYSAYVHFSLRTNSSIMIMTHDEIS